MTTANSGAVFFLGTRAHYQVLQQPECKFDSDNGNASTETIYQNPAVQEIWKDQPELDNRVGENHWAYDNDVNVADEIELTGVKRRAKRHSSETALCERDAEMKPALLNHVGDSDTAKTKPSRRISLFALLAPLTRRRRHLRAQQAQHLHQLASALPACTYRESCRCLDCQSSYFDCDESEGYSSDDSDYVSRYIPRVVEPPPPEESDDEDDDVFIDTVPGDNASTDLLIEGREKMSVSSDEVTEDAEGGLDLEVAAGTPVLLNYLLTHPITCNIQ